jgi:dienelactone hydrolase
MSNSTYAKLAALLAVILCLAGCASKAPASKAAPSTTAPPTSCSAEHTHWLPDPGGGRLSASTVGSGTTAAVFLHETGRTGRCGWVAYARWLTSHAHVLAVLVDRCGNGESTCTTVPTGDADIRAQTQPAIDWAVSHGATRIVLVGASGGGGDALEAAGVLKPVSALVDISGDGNDTGATDTTDAQRDRVPTLFAVAPQDPYVSVSEVRHLFGLVPDHDKRCDLLTTQPAEHGWNLLTDPGSGAVTPFASTVADWIQGHYTGTSNCQVVAE